jgi:hypothetical protein
LAVAEVPAVRGWFEASSATRWDRGSAFSESEKVLPSFPPWPASFRTLPPAKLCSLTAKIAFAAAARRRLSG